MEAYLDNSATTKCSDHVFEIMKKVFLEDYGNPSSLHGKGMEAEQYILEAKKKIAKTLKVQEKEIYFTSGGTESNNLAILGTAHANKRSGNHIITTSIEHASVFEVVKHLEEEGYQATYLDVNEKGHISLDQLKKSIRKDTILVSLMYINNEIGAIEPILEAIQIVKEVNPDILIHVDAIQAYGKFIIHPKKMGIDLLSVSGHKIHGPKGIGFLYVREKVKIKPILFGGGHQKGLRSGTENVPAIAGLGVACEEAYADFEKKQEYLFRLKQIFVQQVTQLEGVTINGAIAKDSAPHIVSVSVEGVRSEVLLHALEEKQVYVSAGSACSSNKPAVSHTLLAIHVKKDLLESTIRFSFSTTTTENEITYTIDVLKELVPALQKYKRH